MANYWIKAYIEILDDPKMATLPDRLWRRVHEVFYLAGRFNKGGELPETSQLAWVLRMSTDDLELDLKQIALIGIIKKTPTGWFVVNFAKRQASVPGSVRVNEFRKRQQNELYNDDVTPLKRDVTQMKITDTDKDTDTDTDKEAEEDTAFTDNPFSTAFVQASKIAPHTLDKWCKSLEAIEKTGALPEDVTAAVMELRDKDYNIAGPWSIKNAVIIAKGKREKPARGNGKPTIAQNIDKLSAWVAQKEQEALSGNA